MSKYTTTVYITSALLLKCIEPEGQLSDNGVSSIRYINLLSNGLGSNKSGVSGALPPSTTPYCKEIKTLLVIYND